MKEVQAVILAAGEGSRFRPLTKNRPQVLLPVANKPVLQRVLDAVVACGIRDITVVVGYKKEPVMKLLNSYPVRVNVVVQSKQLGSANALFAAKKFIHTNTLILSGNNFVGIETIRLLLQSENAILASPHANPENFGIISQKDGILTDIVEKPKSTGEMQIVNCGVYYLNKELIDFADSSELFDMPDFMKKLVAQNEKINVVSIHDWQGVLTPADLLGVNDYYLEKLNTSLCGKIDRSAKISGHVSIGKDTVVSPGVVITGPVVIGDNCHIEPNVCIGPGTAIGSRVSIEPFCYLKDVIVMNDCSIGSGSRITNAVLGEGNKLANNVSTLGNVVVGDHSEIGPFSLLKDCAIGNNVVIDGGRTISEKIPDNARVI